MPAPASVRRPRPALVPGDLEEIGLAELNATAAMLTRVDRKYAVTLEEAEAVAAGLHEGTRVLSIDGITAQSYASTYFDTPDLDSFLDAARPRRRRFKIRTRAYLDSGIAFLEVKTRGARGRTVKTRIPYDLEAALEGRLTPEGATWALGRLDAADCAVPEADSLVPVLSGTYARTTLLMADGSGRATLDAGLEWADLRGPSDSPRWLAAPDLVIIETKSGSAPSPLDHLLWSRGHRPVRLSKYATALAALDPDLPANRWTRTLAQSFGAARPEPGAYGGALSASGAPSVGRIAARRAASHRAPRARLLHRLAS
ncbi:polyphosphate polymerase domain-containing protein [Actinomyces culturomici]|uniref:polyphosphate polymerase domain-containing protein n=1 Tax=Actinomyces culturomici TaxID=1926276 RepID=UPI002E25B4BD